MKTTGIVAHSAEGAALCFITACREGQNVLDSTRLLARDAVREAVDERRVSGGGRWLPE